jgi:8-oxo-dGTP pyrophosphatase MutT (NUDIX family)
MRECRVLSQFTVSGSTLSSLATGSFPYQDVNQVEYRRAMQSLYTLIWKDDQGQIPLGFVPQFVLEELIRAPREVKGNLEINHAECTILLFNQSTESERSEIAAALTSYWRANRTFKMLAGWRDELWPIYGRHNDDLLYNMERSAIGLLGVMRYGVHMTAFVRSEASSHGIKIWVPKRAATKSTFPGMLDNTVAGGLMTGEDPFECIIREADEEASLSEDIVRSRAKLVGEVTYIYITEERAGGEAGLIYPECQWVYDLELFDDVIPKPKDGEVEEFSLCTIEEVQVQLAQGRFKPNCALVVLDFFMRHGILTRENEPDYDEINRRIHRELPFPGPHKRSSFSRTTRE